MNLILSPSWKESYISSFPSNIVTSANFDGKRVSHTLNLNCSLNEETVFFLIASIWAFKLAF